MPGVCRGLWGHTTYVLFYELVCQGHLPGQSVLARPVLFMAVSYARGWLALVQSANLFSVEVQIACYFK